MKGRRAISVCFAASPPTRWQPASTRATLPGGKAALRAHNPAQPSRSLSGTHHVLAGGQVLGQVDGGHLDVDALHVALVAARLQGDERVVDLGGGLDVNDQLGALLGPLLRVQMCVCV